MEEPIGNIAAGALLGFFLEEIAPVVTTGRLPTCRRLQARVAELDLEVHEEEFAYWRKHDKAKRGR